MTKKIKSEEDRIKDLSKFKKIELIKIILKTDNKQIEEQKLLLNKNKVLIQKIVTQKEIIDKLSSKKEEFVFNIGKKVFIEYLSAKGLPRTAKGFINKETNTKIKLLIKDKNKEYFYIIFKNMITGVKEYY